MKQRGPLAADTHASNLGGHSTYEHNEWIIHLAGKLLANDVQALSLLAHNPFEGRAPPSLACFDDATLGGLFPSGPGRLKDQVLKIQEEEAQGAGAPRTRGCVARSTVNLVLGILVAWLSIPVVLNLLSPRQVMNSSFNPLRIVNTYGAFGSITRERTEVILQGTASANASAPDASWEDYEFKCKPGDLRRRPCLISPYHHRLDWLMWFAAFQVPEDSRGWVRGEHYRYKFSRPGGRHAAEGKWWIRRRLGPYFPPLNLQDLRGYFTSREWPYPEPE
ncbi:LMF1 [Cervus elaphus hippelaphus]|uniref:LMF1 n=1 Tax=Cervus elaphus hippelaphus TaxID=46360 RepID=A0A212CZ34_CEREH|nr:LMF1 [Cervus elaphus hippelaphus]